MDGHRLHRRTAPESFALEDLLVSLPVLGPLLELAPIAATVPLEDLPALHDAGLDLLRRTNVIQISRHFHDDLVSLAFFHTLSLALIADLDG